MCADIKETYNSLLENKEIKEELTVGKLVTFVGPFQCGIGENIFINMPETKLKSLHIGKSIADLKCLYDVGDLIKGKKAKLLCSSAQKLYEEAEKFRIQGDEEQAYIRLMKYLAIVSMVQRSDEYKKDREYFNQMLGKHNMKQALNEAEKLSKSLEQRYNLMKEQEEIEAAQLAQESRDAEEQLKRKQAPVDKSPQAPRQVNGLPGPSDVSISSKDLFKLLTEKKVNVLILDARPASTFATSHMSIGNCINVPEDIVLPGASASALEKRLPPDSKAAWNNRKVADFVVLLDWHTSEKTLLPASNLFILKNILLKWDPGIIYKNEPLILEGGYEDWLLTYPMHTTNPKVEIPSQASGSELDDLLDDVTYPAFIESPLVPQPAVDRASKPNFRKGSVSLDNVSSARTPALTSASSFIPTKTTVSNIDRTSSADKPGVDRASKAAAMQTYEERSRVASELILSRKKLEEIEESRQKTDKEMEIIRLGKEKEAEQERVLFLQSREEELLHSIMKMEERNRDQEAEKLILKGQLEKYKKQEEEALKLKEAHKQKEKAETEGEERKKQEAKEREEREKERKSADERQKIKDAEKAKKLEEEKRKEKERERGRSEYDRGVYYTSLKSDDMPSSSGSMQRSHSYPNIAQMTDNMESDAKHNTPQFDRAIKPFHKPQPSEVKAARQRNFSEVWGSSGQGLTGLKNLGNSCYMNSILQCINNTTPLAFYFCEDKYRDDVNYQTSTRGEVAEEVAAVIKALWFGHYRSIACRDLKSIVGQHRKQFQGYEQQDSHEFFTILMDWLHEDLNKSDTKPPLSESTNDNMSPADKAWEKFRRCNQSLIRTLFYGQQKSTVRCCKCREESITYEAFSDLSVPLPSSINKCSLMECLKLYLNGEKITGWNCPSCKDKRDAIKKFDIWRFPPILVIHLNRFYHDGWWRKRQTYVDFPFTMDVRQLTPVLEQRYVSYNLYGVSNHYGTMEGGHYTAYCKNNVTRNWYKFDDHEVSELSNNEVRTGAAYILFYAAVEYKIPGHNS